MDASIPSTSSGGVGFFLNQSNAFFPPAAIFFLPKIKPGATIKPITHQSHPQLDFFSGSAAASFGANTCSSSPSSSGVGGLGAEGLGIDMSGTEIFGAGIDGKLIFPKGLVYVSKLPNPDFREPKNPRVDGTPTLPIDGVVNPSIRALTTHITSKVSNNASRNFHILVFMPLSSFQKSKNKST